MARGTEVIAVVDATRPEGSGLDGLGHWSIYETTIGNLPLIGLVCEEIAATGARTVHVVTPSATRRELGRVIGGGDPWGLEIRYVDVSAGSGRQAVLEEVHNALSSRAVILHPGDCLLRRGLSAMTRRYVGGDVDFVIPDAGQTDPQPTLDRRVIHSPVVLGPPTRHVVGRLLEAQDERQDLRSALVSSDLRSGTCETREAWRYSDMTPALLSGNRLVLDAMEGDADLSRLQSGNRLHGRIRVAPSASVHNSVIVGPVSIGEHAVVEDSYVGPFTSIASRAILSGAEIDNAIVLSGAELRHPGSRIEASIIGAGASVAQSFDLPRGMHLRLGAGSRLTLS